MNIGWAVIRIAGESAVQPEIQGAEMESYQKRGLEEAMEGSKDEI